MFSWIRESWPLIRIAGPVVATLVAQMTMQVVDLMVAGRVSPEAVGAVGLASSIYAWGMVFGLGVLSSLDYLVSKSVGAGNLSDARLSFHQSLIASVICFIPVLSIHMVVSYQFEKMGIEPHIAQLTGECLRILAWSLLPFFLFFAARLYLQAQHLVKPAMWILLWANLVNVVANGYLVLGWFGGHSFGAHGISYATLVSRFFMVLAMAWVLWRRSEPIWPKLETARLKELFRLGLPSSFQLMFEVGVFSLVTTLSGRLGAFPLAAHQMVLNMASFTFMVALGLSSATAVIVGQSIGAKKVEMARFWGWRGLALGTSFMTCSAVIMLSFPEKLMGMYSADTSVLSYAVGIVFLAGVFQISDGAQAILTGALRGIGDTRSAMIANFVGHWCMGLPLAIWLAFDQNWGLKGLWTGLAVGLTIVALALLRIWAVRSRALQPHASSDLQSPSSVCLN